MSRLRGAAVTSIRHGSSQVPEDLRATLLCGGQPNKAYIIDFLAPFLSSPHSLMSLSPLL